MKTYADFMVVLSPPENVKALIQRCKQEAVKRIGPYEDMHAIANISIKNMPRQKPYATAPIIRELYKTMRAMPPVMLTVDGFDFFIHGDDYRTVYAKIRQTPATQQWFKLLKRNLNMKDYLVPHMVIARNIPVEQFGKLWPAFQQLNWVEPFWIDKLTFLYRDAFDSFAHWEIFTELPFEGKTEAENAPAKREQAPVKRDNTIANQQFSLF
jgi:2'-5' RNA ligase